MKGTKDIIDKLLEALHTTAELKEVSDVLEELSQDTKFKNHANAIVSDNTLTDSQKKRQLTYLIKTIDSDILQTFFTAQLEEGHFWLFSAERIDYFDKFVGQFQLATEEVGVVHLITAVELGTPELIKIAEDLGKSFGYKVMIKHEVEPKILGGAQVKVENLVFDFSLRTKFQQFRQSWLSSLTRTEKTIGHNQEE